MNYHDSESAYFREWAFVKGRSFLLTILALGSVLVTHKIGVYFAALLAPDIFFISLIIKAGFVALGWAGIDWVLANALAEVSSVHPDDTKGSNRPVWIFAVCALATTLLLSLASNQFISSELAGETHLVDFNIQVGKAMTQDSVLKSKAFTSLQNATKEQQVLVQAAIKEKGRLVAQAIQNGSTGWQRLYYAQHKNRESFFHKCRRCSGKFKSYREGIQAAIEQGDKLVYDARNHTKFIQTTLSPTLSYQISKDTLLASVRDNTLKLEQERQTREVQLNRILLVMTLGCGILAFILTIVLRHLRKKHGQQVTENNVQFIMVVFDMSARFGNALADIIYTLLVQPFTFMQGKGWIKRYELTDSRSNRLTDNGYNATVTDKPVAVKRLCKNCTTDIAHKRSDAIYCGDKCRLEHHGFVPNKRKESGNGVI